MARAERPRRRKVCCARARRAPPETARRHGARVRRPDPGGEPEDPLGRHRVPVPPGQRLLVPDGLRSSERRGRAPHGREPGLHALRRAARQGGRDLDGLSARRRGRRRRLRRRRGAPGSAALKEKLAELIAGAEPHLPRARARRVARRAAARDPGGHAAALARRVRCRPRPSSTRAISSTRCVCTRSPPSSS